MNVPGSTANISSIYQLFIHLSTSHYFQLPFLTLSYQFQPFIQCFPKQCFCNQIVISDIFRLVGLIIPCTSWNCTTPTPLGGSLSHIYFLLMYLMVLNDNNVDNILFRRPQSRRPLPSRSWPDWRQAERLKGEVGCYKVHRRWSSSILL